MNCTTKISRRTVLLFSLLSLCLVLSCELPHDEEGSEGGHAGYTITYPLVDEYPSWSPTGEFIAYCHNGIDTIREDGAGGGYTDSIGLYIIPAEGGQRRLLVNGYCYFPSWSPSGTRILFSLFGKIHVYDLTSDSLSQLTFEGDSYSPHQHPFENRIVFTSNIQRTQFDIWQMDTLGGNQIKIGNSTGDEGLWRGPSWSPDGRIIVFHRVLRDEEKTLIFGMESNGSNEFRYTNGNNKDQYPAFSPNNAQIAYQTKINGSGMTQISIVDTMTLSISVLTTGGGVHPSWSPDGERIVYSKYNPWEFDDTNGHLWIIDVTSGEERQLTHRTSAILTKASSGLTRNGTDDENVNLGYTKCPRGAEVLQEIRIED